MNDSKLKSRSKAIVSVPRYQFCVFYSAEMILAGFFALLSLANSQNNCAVGQYAHRRASSILGRVKTLGVRSAIIALRIIIALVTTTNISATLRYAQRAPTCLVVVSILRAGARLARRALVDSI